MITDSFPTKQIGSIKIETPKNTETETETKNIDSDSDYDEDEQLYKAIKSSKNADEEIPIPILQLIGSPTIFIVTPHFTNVIANFEIAEKLVQNVKVNKSWITLSPCNLNNGQTISKLEKDPLDGVSPNSPYSSVPFLKPPHFITGIAASFNSIINTTKEQQLFSLALNSDGQPGFEKLDNDALIDTTYVLVDLIVKDEKEKEGVLNKISKSVRKFNSYSNSGMYL